MMPTKQRSVELEKIIIRKKIWKKWRRSVAEAEEALKLTNQERIVRLTYEYAANGGDSDDELYYTEKELKEIYQMNLSSNNNTSVPTMATEQNPVSQLGIDKTIDKIEQRSENLVEFNCVLELRSWYYRDPRIAQHYLYLDFLLMRPELLCESNFSVISNGPHKKETINKWIAVCEQLRNLHAGSKLQIPAQ